MLDGIDQFEQAAANCRHVARRHKAVQGAALAQDPSRIATRLGQGQDRPASSQVFVDLRRHAVALPRTLDHHQYEAGW